MATNVTLFRDETDLVINKADSTGLDEITKRLLGNSTYKRISIKGGKFRMIVNGQEAARSPDPKMDVVIVNAAPHVSRAYYAKLYDPNAISVPDCWSNDGIKPDARSAAPQGKTCETCPMNKSGSGSNGKSRACKYSRRLAVLLGNNIENSDVYQMQLAPTSLFGKAPDEDHMGLDAYVKHLAAYNYSITRVVTEMRFDEHSDTPRLYFRAVRRLKGDELTIAAEKGASPEAEAAIVFNPGTLDASARKDAAVAPTPFREEAEPVVRSNKSKPVPAKEESIEDTLDDWATDD